MRGCTVPRITLAAYSGAATTISPLMADDRGHPIVGGPHHGPPGFHGAQPADLQMLVARGRMSEPGIIGDVGKHRRGAHGGQQGASRRHLRNRCRRRFSALPLPAVPAALAPRLKSEYGRLISLQPVANELRHGKELDERHQVVLVVPATPGVAVSMASTELKYFVLAGRRICLGVQRAHDQRRTLARSPRRTHRESSRRGN